MGVRIWRRHLSRALRLGQPVSSIDSGKSSQCVYAIQLMKQPASPAFLAQAPNNSRERSSLVLTQAGPTGFPALDVQTPGRSDPAGTCEQRRPLERDRGGEQRHHGRRSPTRANGHSRDAGIDLTSPAGADCHTADAHGSLADFRVPSCPRAAAAPTAIGLLGSARRPQLPAPPEVY